MAQHFESENDNKEKEAAQAAEATRPTTLQRVRAKFLKGVSYFSGDMEVFGKWMESKI